MADPALTSHDDDDSLTSALNTFTWSVGTAIDWYRVKATWTRVFTLSDDSTTSQSEVVDSGQLNANRLSHEFNLPMDGETITFTLSWSSAGTAGSTEYEFTAASQPGYQRSSLWHDYESRRWYQCERCGFFYLDGELSYDPYTGLYVCFRYCLDPAQPGDVTVNLSGRRANPYLEQG